MKSIVIAGLILSLTGCTTSEQLAKNLSEKSVSGSGLIADNRIGVDENKIPTLKSVFISGDFKTIKADSNFIDYSEEISGSIFNAENKTKKTRLTITTKSTDNLAETLKNAIELYKLRQMEQ
jgi:lipoprotein|nr:MAG TPA: TRAF PROTEIN, TRAO PROTEIN, TRAN ADHESION, BACTERIAL SECRETION.5A [Bacteriophage sp.]